MSLEAYKIEKQIEQLKLRFELSPKQDLAMRARRLEKYERILFGGSVGGGKSYLMCLDLLVAGIQDYPGDKFVMVRSELESAKDKFWRPFVNLIPPELIAEQNNQHRPFLRLVPPYNTMYQCVDARSIDKVWGDNLRAVYADEAHMIGRKFFDLIETRFRSAVGQSQYHYAFLCTNPAPGWLYSDFVKTKKPGNLFVPCLPKENPFIDSDDYLKRMERYLTPEQYARYALGQWDVFEGQVYPEFDIEVHVQELDPKGDGWNHLQALDWGHVNPAAVLFSAIDHNGRWLIYDEIYETGLTPKSLVNNHYDEKQRQWQGCQRFCLADPSIKKRERDGGSVYRDFINAGLSVVLANNTMYGIMHLKQMLRDRQVIIHPRCVNLIQEIQGYIWDNKTAAYTATRNFPDTPVAKDNHLLDCWRYLANYLKGGAIAKPVEDPLSGAAAVRAFERQQQRGGEGAGLGKSSSALL